MKLKPQEIFNEYTKGANFKRSIGAKGIYEQSRINERFYTGDQWHGIDNSSKRPLVRHNIIKRIGDYKMSQILSNDMRVKITAEGVPQRPITNRMPQSFTSNTADENEINAVLSALSSYREATAERIGFDNLCARALKNSFISGSGVIYTYWDSDINTGLYVERNGKTAVKGDIKSEVIDIEDVYFADPYTEDVQSQDYIIITSLLTPKAVASEAEAFGADRYAVSKLRDTKEDKILVLTKLYKERNSDGTTTVKCIKVTEKLIVRPSFDTKLRLYPIAVFHWEERKNSAFGDTELSYLIPNQIAINRMITANVWSAVTLGMPMMVVNGDTVNENITNDPGQIIKVFGSNEDVAGAVRYVTPPDICSEFGSGINELIKNTLIQSGANEVALGDSKAENATALQFMQSAATLPLKLMKRRFYSFIESITRIWVDFWITHYGVRKIKITDNSGEYFIDFDTSRYKHLYLTAKADVLDKTAYSHKDTIAVLDNLLEKGIIDKKQYVARLPEGIISDAEGIFTEKERETLDDGKQHL